MYKRLVLCAACLLACGTATLRAQDSNFVGFQTGISTVSADARSVVSGTSTSISLYKPENGPTFKSVAGRHLNDYLSLQATYGWNRNTLRLTSSESSDDRNAFYEQTRSATQHTALAEFLVYVRKKGKTVRPYLSVGLGAIHFNSGASTIRGLIEEGVAAPGAISSTGLAVRSAVGIDVFIKGGWAFRFSFDETIRNNPISAQLNPPGERKLAHFQNLFGFVKTF